MAEITKIKIYQKEGKLWQEHIEIKSLKAPKETDEWLFKIKLK